MFSILSVIILSTFVLSLKCNISCKYLKISNLWFKKRIFFLSIFSENSQTEVVNLCPAHVAVVDGSWCDIKLLRKQDKLQLICYYHVDSRIYIIYFVWIAAFYYIKQLEIPNIFMLPKTLFWESIIAVALSVHHTFLELIITP